MKNYRKILSIILTLCMLMQMLPVFAADGDAVNPSAIQYIVNEQFGAGDKGGFELNSAATGTLDAVDPDSDGNYELEYTSGGGYFTNSQYAILDIDGADFIDGAELVIKTRIKFSGSDRAIFKFNKSDIDDANGEYKDWGMFFTIANSGFTGSLPHASTGVIGSRAITTTSTTFANTWFNAEIRATDAENMTLKLTDDNGGTTGEVNIYPNSDDTTGINNIFLRAHTGDKVYLDYLQVYYEYETKMEVKERYNTSKPITVAIDTVVGNEAFKDAVAIYDAAGQKVATQNAIDETCKIVTLTPADENALVNDMKYTVRLDKTAIPANYVIDEAEKEFLYSDIEYIVNEQFGANDLGGFALNSTSEGTLNAANLEGNYALEFSHSGRYYTDKEYAILNIEGADFVEGAELVVKTRIKLDGSGRAVFKYNKDISDTSDGSTDNGLFFALASSGFTGRIPHATTGAIGTRAITTTSTAFADTWFNVEIRAKDAENMTLKLTDDNGGTTDEVNIYPTVGNTDGIENIYLRSDKEDKVYLDYLQVYYEYETKMEVKERYSVNKPITVTFDTAVGNEVFKDAVAIYDAAGKKVATQNTIDATNKIVTLTPETALTESLSYKVRLEKAGIPGNYVIDEDEKAFIASDIDYIVNEHFGANDLGGFALNSTSEGTLNAANLEGNYALEFSHTGRYYTDKEYAILNIEGADFAEGAELVVKTRIKLDGSGRAVFKYNKDTSDGSNDNGMFFTIDSDSISGRIPSATTGTIGTRDITTTSTTFANTWFNAEIRATDAENMTLTLTDDNGGTTGEVNIYPTVSDTAGIKNIFLRSDTNDKVYLDYIQVYYDYKTKMGVDASYGVGQPVTVTFDTAVGNEAFKGAVSLYDAAGQKVATENTIDDTNKIVTLTPEKALTENAGYTVRLDKTNISGNYVFDRTVKSFIVSDTNYIVYEQFGADDLGGFTQIATGSGAVSAEETPADSGKYALKYIPNARHWSNTDYAALNVDGADFEEGKTIVIKTRIKFVSGGAGQSRAILKYGEDADSVTSNDGSFFTIGSDGISARLPHSTTGVIDVRSMTTTSTVFENTWFNAEIRFTDAENVKLVISDDNGGTTGLVDIYPTSSNTAGIDNIFISGDKGDEVYLDYIEIYEISAYEATATVAEKVLNTESIDVVFESANAIESIPEGAVTLKDKSGKEVSAAQSYNKAAKTLTLTPAANLEIGSVYTVNVDAAALAEVSMTYTGETAFKVLATGANGLLYAEDFDNGTGRWQSAEVKKANGVVLNNIVTLDTTPPTGESATVMHFAATEDTGWDNTARPNAYYNFENPITFSEDKNIVVKTRIMHIPSAAADNDYYSSFLKINRPLNIPNDASLNEAASTNKPYSVLGFYKDRVDIYGAGNRLPLEKITDEMSGKWIDVELVFDGKAEERTLKLSDGNEKTYTSREGYTISVKTEDMEQPVVTRSSLAHTDAEVYTLSGLDPTADDFAGYTALESLNFVMHIKPEDLYVDYVEVYETEASDTEVCDVYATMPAGNTVKYDGAIQLKFDGVNSTILFPTNAVTLKSATGTDVATTASFSKATGILYVKPKADLTKGEYYSVNISPTVLSAVGINYIGSTYFTVTARDDFETGRVIIDNQFNTDGNTEGWAPGNASDGYAAEIEAKDGMLHIVSPKATAYGAGNLSTVTKLLGDGIELTDGKTIVIKTKVKNVTEGGAYKLALNQPEDYNNMGVNAGIWSIYSLVRTSDSDANSIAVPADKRVNLGGDTGNYVYAWGLGEKTFDEDGDVNGAQGIETLNKWIEYTITITDEDVNNLHVKADILDDNGNVTETYESDELNDATIKTSFDAYERVFGKVPGYTTEEDYADETKRAVMDNMYNKWLSADRLTFVSAEQGKATELYVDYITVEQIDTREVETTASAALKVNGTPSTSLRVGDTVIPEFTLQGEAGTEFTTISAIYVNGVLKDTHIKEHTAENADEFTYAEADGYTVPEGQVVIKAFVWESLDSLIPIGKAAKASSGILEVYVQADGNDATGTGEEGSPVATLGKALAVAKQKYNENPDLYPKTEIIVGDGVYNVDGTIYIDENYTSFGEGGLDIKAAEGAKPVIAGGVSYDINSAVKVEDAAILNRLHSEAAKQNLYELNLTSKIGLGAIPAVNYPGSHNVTKMLSEAGVETAPQITCEALFDNNLMKVARYPNSGYATMGDIVDAGVAGQYMLPEFDNTENDLEATAENLLKGFEFKTDYANLAKWADADQALIFGYFKENWATQTVPLKEIDATNGTIRSKYPSYYGVAEGARYYVYNLLEEIDEEGEYFIDRKTGKMYFYMPSDKTETSKINITRNTSDLITIRNVENVTLDGIKVTGSMSAGIHLEGNNNTVKNCEIANTGSYGVNVRGTNNTVDNCFIHDTNVGVLLEGGVTDTLTPGNNTVNNCEITRFSRTNKTYTPAVAIYGVGNNVTHNEIYDGEHTAITFNGQNNIISYNEVYNVCKEVDDAGALYVGRTWTSRGNKIISNYFHDITSNIEEKLPNAALYFDDHFAGAYVEGNVIANIDGYGIHGNGGREHTIKNNVFIDCDENNGVYVIDSNINRTYATHIAKLSEVPYTNDVWRVKFPELYNILNNSPSYPMDYIFADNLFVNCGENGYFFGNLATSYAKEPVSDNYVTDEDPGFADMTNKDYTITADALAQKIPGFKTIEFNKMGRQ